MDKPAPEVKEPFMAKDDPEREHRLAEALRANLRRRKAQAREVESDDHNGAVSPLSHSAASSSSCGPTSD
jgi:hypothetical protein